MKRKSLLQTVIVSLVLPIVFVVGWYSCHWGFFEFEGEPYFALPIILLVPVVYYLLIMRERKSDELIDEAKRRMMLCFGLQFAEMLIAAAAIFAIGRPKENGVTNGHWDGDAAALIFAAVVVVPHAIMLGGCVVSFIVKAAAKILGNNKKRHS